MALQCSSWSDLPTEILELIFDCTKDPIDILRCGAACKSWLPIALEVYRKFFPLCLINCWKDGIGQTPTLFNMFTKETRNIHLPEAKEIWICCARNKWLLTLDFPNSPMKTRLQLLNIFSRSQVIDLPLPCKPSPKLLSHPTSNALRFNWKLLLTDCPLNSDCMFFLVQKGLNLNGVTSYTISSWKRGKRTWNNRKPGYERINDAILYKGKLYATIVDTSGRLFLITYNYHLKAEAKVLIPKLEHNPSNGYLRRGTLLVKSVLNDDLLLLHAKSNDHDDRNILGNFKVEVYTKELKELNDLGGCTLFFSANGNHLLVKASNCETWFKPNCIYALKKCHWYIIPDLETKEKERGSFCQGSFCQSFIEDDSHAYPRSYRHRRSFWVNQDDELSTEDRNAVNALLSLKQGRRSLKRDKETDDH